MDFSQHFLPLSSYVVLLLAGLISLMITFKINLKVLGAQCMSTTDKSVGLFSSILLQILSIMNLSYLILKRYQSGWKKNIISLSILIVALLLVSVSMIILLIGISTIDPTKSPADDCVSEKMLSACKGASVMTIISATLVLIALEL